MFGKITYSEKGNTIIVKLDNRIVGAIKPNFGGYRYFPSKSSISGDWYKSVEDVKKSIEE